jgi:hypothetical protein
MWFVIFTPHNLFLGWLIEDENDAWVMLHAILCYGISSAISLKVLPYAEEIIPS